MLGERLGRITAEDNTVGDGAAKPKGIVTAATLGVTAASATAITADEVLDLIHSVAPAHHIGSGFILSNGVLLAIRNGTPGHSLYTPSRDLRAVTRKMGQR